MSGTKLSEIIPDKEDRERIKFWKEFYKGQEVKIFKEGKLIFYWKEKK